MEAESYRKLCLKQQSELRKLMKDPNQHIEAMQLFFSQHAMLHSAIMAGTEPWSFEDEVLDDLSWAEIRRIPKNQDHSIVWNIWHIARIEDVAMNLLVAGSPQVFIQDKWLERLQINERDTGNAMSPKSVEELSASIDIEGLRDIIRNHPSPKPPDDRTFKPACVFLLVFDLEEPHILAIQKADSEGYPWRNQVALPGGHLDAEDASPLEGAFRELEEEMSAVAVDRNISDLIDDQEARIADCAVQDLLQPTLALRRFQHQDQVGRCLEAHLPSATRCHHAVGDPGLCTYDPNSWDQ